MKTQSLLSLHAGQYALQSGIEYWQLMADQLPEVEATTPTPSASPFFSTLPDSSPAPNALFFDLDYSSTDALRSHPFFKRNIGPTRLLVDKHASSAGGVFSAARFTTGEGTIDIALERIRQITEKFDHFQGFQIHFALHGGTGAGICGGLLPKLHSEFPKKAIHLFNLMPSDKLAVSTVEPINALFGLEAIEPADLVVCMDNASLYRYFTENCDTGLPNYHSLNYLIARTLVAINQPLWSPGKTLSMKDFQTSLVPYPKAKYAFPSYYQHQSPKEDTKEQYIGINYFEDKQTRNLTRAMQFSLSAPFKLFASNHISYENLPVKMLGFQAHFAGKVVSPFESMRALQLLRLRSKYVKFMDYCPTGIKSVLVNEAKIPSLLNLQHNLNIGSIFNTTMLQPFIMLRQKRGFEYIYRREGLESGAFDTAIEYCNGLVRDYQELGTEVPENGEDDE